MDNNKCSQEGMECFKDTGHAAEFLAASGSDPALDIVYSVKGTANHLFNRKK